MADDSEDVLRGLEFQDWLDGIEEAIGDKGFVQPLGRAHGALFRDASTTLLVTFESYQSIQEREPDAEPFGWRLAGTRGWSQLTIVADGPTWFRDPKLYAQFDRLIDDGFFDQFDEVLFYGAGMGAYGAAAYSVAAPGARVLLIEPRATLNPEIADWEPRFTAQRRLDFSNRYGFAPEMLDAAAEAVVLYDPDVQLDAMHAALFVRPNVTKYRMRFLGDDLEERLRGLRMFHPLFDAFGNGTLTRSRFGQIARARFNSAPYLRTVTRALQDAGRDKLALRYARHVRSTRGGPFFRKTVAALENKLGIASDAKAKTTKVHEQS